MSGPLVSQPHEPQILRNEAVKVANKEKHYLKQVKEKAQQAVCHVHARNLVTSLPTCMLIPAASMASTSSASPSSKASPPPPCVFAEAWTCSVLVQWNMCEDV
jgi:hypothetical protein